MTIGLVSAVAVLMAAAGAGATGAPIQRGIDVSTPAAVKQYLRSTGVSTRGVVIQRGVRNYAGARCPGKGWTCTSTSHPVVQVAAAGGTNRFQGTTGSGPVVQVAAAASATNVAQCIRTTGITQSCSITQTGTGSNTAIVVEIATKLSGLTQNASQRAQIVQTSGSGRNTACVLQTANIDGSTTARRGVPVTVTLDAHQTISITQNSHSGGNTVQSAMASGACDAGIPLNQTQTISSTARGSANITQKQNSADAGPNMLLNIQQNQADTFHGSASGASSAAWSQTNTLTAFAIAATSAGPVTQVQSTADGGIEANVNQFSTTPSIIDAHQSETQCARAVVSPATPDCATANPDLPSGWSQTQFGPMRKGPGSTQEGSDGHDFDVDQNSTQTAAGGGNVNQSNVVEGDCTTSGPGCTVDQTTTVQGVTTHNTQTAQTVSTSINCTGSKCDTAPPIVFDGSPGTSAPPSTLGPYTMTAFDADPQPVCPAEGSFVTGVTDPAGGTIGFSQALRHDHVGGCWATWSHGYTGDVYDTAASVDPTQVTITLPAGTRAFYFYAEPNVFDVFNITATAQDGTTATIPVQGNSGAQYFGFYATGTMNLASISVTTTQAAGGFAVGEFGIAPRAVAIE